MTDHATAADGDLDTDTDTDTARRLADRIGMPDSAVPRLASMLAAARDTTASGAPPIDLPTGDAAIETLAWCGVDGEDRAAMLAARPDPERDPAWWSLLEGAVAELRSGLDLPLPPEGFATWPTVPPDAGPVGMFLYAWALVAVVPELREAHRDRGIPGAVTRASIRQSLPGVMSSHLQVTGIRGVGLFPLWGRRRRSAERT